MELREVQPPPEAKDQDNRNRLLESAGMVPGKKQPVPIQDAVKDIVERLGDKTSAERASAAIRSSEIGVFSATVLEGWTEQS